jgi:hypothetical protein
VCRVSLGTSLLGKRFMKALLLAVLLVFATRSTAQSVKEVQKQIDAKEKQEKQELKMRAKTPLTATFNATPEKIRSELTRICGNKAYIILDSSDNEIRFWAYLVDTGHYPLKNLTPNGQMYGPLIGTAGKCFRAAIRRICAEVCVAES